MLDKIKTIESCGYECEAGKLELNVTWQELKEKAEQLEKEARQVVCQVCDKELGVAISKVLPVICLDCYIEQPKK